MGTELYTISLVAGDELSESKKIARQMARNRFHEKEARFIKIRQIANKVMSQLQAKLEERFSSDEGRADIKFLLENCSRYRGEIEEVVEEVFKHPPPKKPPENGVRA